MLETMNINYIWLINLLVLLWPVLVTTTIVGDSYAAVAEHPTYNEKCRLRSMICWSLELRNVFPQSKPRSTDGAGASSATEQPAEPLTEEEKKTEKKLKKVEKMMKKISEKIQELDEAEVDLDDEDNSSYLVQER